MVTETIKQKDVQDGYMNINNWTRNGITYDAQWCILNKWIRKNKSEDDMFQVRNRILSKDTYINKLSKW